MIFVLGCIAYPGMAHFYLGMTKASVSPEVDPEVNRAKDALRKSESLLSKAWEAHRPIIAATAYLLADSKPVLQKRRSRLQTEKQRWKCQLRRFVKAAIRSYGFPGFFRHGRFTTAMPKLYISH